MAKEQVVELIEMLRREPELRKEMAEVLSLPPAAGNGRFERILEEIHAQRVDMDKRFEASDKRFEALRADFNEGMATFRRHLDAMGARWGLLAEESFRSAMADIICREFGGDVKKWQTFDRECVVRPYATNVEADLLVRDGRHLLIEVKSSMSESDMDTLARTGKLYAKETGVTAELAAVTPAPTPRAMDAAKHHGIRVYTHL